MLVVPVVAVPALVRAVGRVVVESTPLVVVALMLVMVVRALE